MIVVAATVYLMCAISLWVDDIAEHDVPIWLGTLRAIFWPALVVYASAVSIRRAF